MMVAGAAPRTARTFASSWPSGGRGRPTRSRRQRHPLRPRMRGLERGHSGAALARVREAFRSSPRARARGLMTLGNDNVVLPAPARPSRHESHPVRSRDSRRQDRSTCWKFHRGCIGAGRGCTNSVVMRWVGLTISNSDFPSSCQDPKPCSANRSGARSSVSPLA
jgi:hypothetical protein